MSKEKRLTSSVLLRNYAEAMLLKNAIESPAALPLANFSESDLLKLIHELDVHKIELEMMLDEMSERATGMAAELIIANEELAFQNQEKSKRADELVIANEELAYQNEEKTIRAAELIIAIKELAWQTEKARETGKFLALKNEELIKSEEQYRTMIESSLYAMVIIGAGKIIYANPSANLLFGATSEEGLIGTNMIDRVHPDFHQLATARITTCIEDKVIAPKIEMKYLKLDGSVLDVEVQSSPTTYDGVQSIQTAIHDITERKQAEETIVKLSKGVEQSSASIIITDEDGIIEFANPKYCELTGYSREELIGRNPKITQSGKTPIETYEKLWKTILAGKEWRGELLNKKKNGDLYWEFMSISQIKNAKGEITSYIAVKDDITERKKLEEELKLVSARLALATQSGGVGLWNYDLANDSHLWSDQMFALYGIRESDFGSIQEVWHTCVHPGDIHRCTQEIQLAIHGNKKLDTEFRVVWPDGSIHTIKALASVQLDESGRAVRMIGTNWDISEQKRTELEIKLQNKELQKINSEKDKFFSIIAHDMRGPLGGIMGMTEMLTDEIYQLTENDRKQMMANLRRSSRNTFTLLENLLEWAQMVQGLTEFKPQKLDLTQTIAECKNTLEESAKVKRIELLVQIAGEQIVLADKNMLQSVIRNLISNAVKFTSNGGKVNISAESSANNMVMISVKDNGIGMTSEMLNHLFHIDADIKRPGTNNEKSTGLGLLLCKEFVEKLGGKITVESELNKGTVFSFNIPATERDEKEIVIQKDAEDERREVEIKNLNILIAEDDEISKNLFSIYVRDFSKQIYKVKNGVEAVKACRENPDIDLVLMDIEMPLLDGFEASRQIREFNKTVIIIAQTAYSFIGNKEKALAAGFNDFISKPISKPALIEIIKKHIRR